MVLQVTLKRKAVTSPTEDTIFPNEAKYLAMLENKLQFIKGAGERTRNKQKVLDEEERIRARKNDNKRPFTKVHFKEQERDEVPEPHTPFNAP